MKEDIRKMLEDVLPLVNFDSDFLFSELDSLGVTTILMTLSDAYGITLDATDATPRTDNQLISFINDNFESHRNHGNHRKCLWHGLRIVNEVKISVISVISV